MNPGLLSLLSMLLAAPIAFLGVVSCSAAGQSLPADQIAAIDAVFAEFSKPGSPGCAVAVYREGTSVFARGYGEASLEHGVPIAPRTVFDIGSTSKQFTAFAILLLERDGKLSLDDDVRKYVPELRAMGRTVTVRHLMLHTSGLRDYLVLWSLAGVKTENWTTQDDAVRLVARQRRANFAAGDEWLYSNTGYLLLAEIVKRVSGKPISQFAAERIFRPLGMSRTFFLDDHARVVPGRATGYMPRKGGGFSVEMSDFEQMGDGAVQTTVEDLAAWDRNFCDPRVGDRALLDKAQTVGTLNNGRKLDYAAGLIVRTYRGLPTVRHGGSWAGYRAELLRFPVQKTTVACLCNLGSANPSALADRVADVLLAQQMGPRPAGPSQQVRSEIAVPPEALAPLAGVYEPVMPGSFMVLSLKDGVMRLGAGEGQPLRPVAGNRFVSSTPGLEIVFPPAGAGSPREMQVIRDGEPAEVFRQVSPPPAQNLEEFAGGYYSEELDAVWTVNVDGTALSVTVLHDPPTAFRPVKRGLFLADNGITLRFEREAGGIRRLAVQAGRVTNLIFEKRGAASALR